MNFSAGNINQFTRPVGRGCSWYKAYHPKNGSFALIMDEDMDLRVLERVDFALDLITGCTYNKLVMIGERKGQLTIVLRDLYHTEFEAILKEKLSEHEFFKSKDVWEVKVYSQNNLWAADSIAHPPMPDNTFEWLLSEVSDENN